MGYESRLYIVDKSTLTREINGKEMLWGEVIAVFNLCKVYSVSDKMRQYKGTDAYIYGVECSTEIIDDPYGEPLREIPIPDAIKILEDAAETEEYYSRYNPCIQLLKGFDLADWENLVVLHYGY